jgi:ankyrin repeat protein
MLSASADPRAVDFAGNSACHLAARNGHSSVLQLLDAQLQDASASQFELLNNDGLSALELARIRQRASALSFLGDMQARLAATQSSCHSIQVCHDAEPQA